MPGVQKVRSKVNVVMNRFVREGVIAGFKTNFGLPDDPHTPQVIVTAPEERPPEAVRLLVADALAEVVIGIDVTVVRDRP